LIHNGGGSKNQGPLLRHRHQQRHRHRHLLVESDWTQVGSDINGEGLLFGFSVAMSADGNRFVAGAIEGAGDAGTVRVFQRVNADSWQQVGNTIYNTVAGDFEEAWDYFGYSVAMSADGSHIAVGALNGNGLSFSGTVSIFHLVNDSWQQVGNTIHGEAAQDQFGHCVTMSANGSRIAVGAPQNYPSKGRVRIFDAPTTGFDWIPVGNIAGQADGEYFGFSVDMVANGSRIVAGALYGANNHGQVRVFDQPTIGSDWIQVGSDIDDPTFNWFGHAVAISAEGSHIVVGDLLDNTENGISSGSVSIFQLVNDSWQQVGDTLIGDAEYDSFGYSVAMSANGSRIAVLRASYSVRVFDQPNASSSAWKQIGSDIAGVNPGGLFSGGLAMSANGATVAVGAPYYDGDEEFIAHVRVFEECPLVHCDFATLQVARYLSNSTQKQRLLEACGILSITAKKNGISRNVNVFNSSNIRSASWTDDPDLGSPNQNCPSGGGPGIGIGGGPSATYPNCVPQGNLLIIQDTGTPESRPNDSGNGGCMYIKFQNDVSLVDMGLLDTEEPGLTITVRTLMLLPRLSPSFCLRVVHLTSA
jgi:hypothetical protein